MNNPLVSIIIPVYNIEDFVEKCLDSVYCQSYENIEMIVVDDGSTDKSGLVCDAFADGKKNVKVFHNKNGGLSFARNFGIKKAKGNLIALVDGDDFVKKDFVKDMVEAMVGDNSDIVVCGFEGEKIERGTISGEAAAKKLLIGQENLEIVSWNKLYKKDLFIKNDIWYPVGDRYEDSLTTYKLLSKAGIVSYLPEKLYVYVKRANSIMGSSKLVERLMARERAAKEAIDFFAGKKELVSAAEVALLTSKFAYVDAGIAKKINRDLYEKSKKWIRKHTNKYRKNSLLTQKLRLYLCLINIFNGAGYRIFRKIKRPDL